MSLAFDGGQPEEEGPGLASPRLARLVRAAESRRQPGVEEVCDLCAEPVPPEHRHLLDLERERLRCVCRSCSILFDRKAAAEGRLRLIPERYRRLEGFRLSDELWNELAIPVGLAYFLRSTAEDRVRAFYPGPAGATESRLGLDAWERMERENPVLIDLEPDVEALLVRRAGAGSGASSEWLVPLDACFRLVALLRIRWRGLSGGSEVWEGVSRYFQDLQARTTRR